MSPPRVYSPAFIDPLHLPQRCFYSVAYVDLERVPRAAVTAASPATPLADSLFRLATYLADAHAYARPATINNVVLAARSTVYSALYGPPATQRRAGLSARDHLTGSPWKIFSFFSFIIDTKAPYNDALRCWAKLCERNIDKYVELGYSVLNLIREERKV